MIGSTTAGSHTYTSRVGSYVKIGKLVYASYYIVIANAGRDTNMAGNIRITGLPYAANAFVRNTCEYNILNLGANYYNVLAVIDNGNSFIGMVKTGVGVAGAYLTAAEVASGQTVVFTGCIVYSTDS